MDSLFTAMGESVTISGASVSALCAETTDIDEKQHDGRGTKRMAEFIVASGSYAIGGTVTWNTEDWAIISVIDDPPMATLKCERYERVESSRRGYRIDR